MVVSINIIQSLKFLPDAVTSCLDWLMADEFQEKRI